MVAVVTGALTQIVCSGVYTCHFVNSFYQTDPIGKKLRLPFVYRPVCARVVRIHSPPCETGDVRHTDSKTETQYSLTP